MFWWLVFLLRKDGVRFVLRSLPGNSGVGHRDRDYSHGAPLTSLPLPPGAGNQPLLAFDPSGGNLPYRFG